MIAIPTKAQTVTKLSADEFEKKMAATKLKTLLDVRTDAEYKEGRLADATQLDYYKDDFKKQVDKLDKTKPIFVYCKGGGRSNSSCEILRGLGFKEVYDLKGGITSWKNANKPIVK
jgi:rhodanese-related sulfurtransferase